MKEYNLLDVVNEINNVFSQVSGAESMKAEPKVDIPMNIIHEEDGSSTIEVAIVGKTREDVKVKGIVEDGKTYLTVESVEKEKTEEEQSADAKRTYTLRKIKGTGKLSAKIFVPANLDIKKTTVKVENGLLTVNIPVADEAKPIEFEIA